jgi:hypothetical protein
MQAGRPAECHEIAHADVEADCAVELASCTADCEAALNDGGMWDRLPRRGCEPFGKHDSAVDHSRGVTPSRLGGNAAAP